VRLHSAIGFVTPLDRLENRHLQIFADRDKKLESARQTRKSKRDSASKSSLSVALKSDIHAEPVHNKKEFFTSKYPKSGLAVHSKHLSARGLIAIRIICLYFLAKPRKCLAPAYTSTGSKIWRDFTWESKF
jgi:hypothetical protein